MRWHPGNTTGTGALPDLAAAPTSLLRAPLNTCVWRLRRTKRSSRSPTMPKWPPASRRATSNIADTFSSSSARCPPPARTATCGHPLPRCPARCLLPARLPPAVHPSENLAVASHHFPGGRVLLYRELVLVAVGVRVLLLLVGLRGSGLPGGRLQQPGGLTRTAARPIPAAKPKSWKTGRSESTWRSGIAARCLRTTSSQPKLLTSPLSCRIASHLPLSRLIS